MIPQIKEIKFPDYATLSQATVTLADMGESAITTQIKIDGDVAPDFTEDWVIEFAGQRYVHSARQPQAAKDNTDKRAMYDLTFKHEAIVELQRYYFVEMASVSSGTAIADKYKASLGLNLQSFIVAFNNVLDYYFNGRIRAVLNPDWISSETPVYFDIDYTYIWEVLQKMYQIYGVRWTLERAEAEADADDETPKYLIKFGYETNEATHIFEYGYNGGLLKVERQVQSTDIRNILLGRGGSKNLPVRYFKKEDNALFPNYAGDPDWCSELENIEFTELRSAEFRSYIQGWNAKHNRRTLKEEEAYVDWAWRRGNTDEKFNPVEYVKDDDSILKYGEMWGALENNEEIYPSIEGSGLDDVIAVDEILTDEIPEPEVPNSTITSLEEMRFGTRVLEPGGSFRSTDNSGSFTVSAGMTGVIEWGSFNCSGKGVDGSDFSALLEVDDYSFEVHDYETGQIYGSEILQPGKYYYSATVTVKNISTSETVKNISVRLSSPTLIEGEGAKAVENTDIFHIWIKDIWGIKRNDGETDAAYTDRVWRSILGVDNEEAAVAFRTGLLSVSDYEFKIVHAGEGEPAVAYDASKTNKKGEQSTWRLTLQKSDAEYEATGLLLPNTKINAKEGDLFYFLGIELPHKYVLLAEQRLHDYKLAALENVKEIQPTWVVSIDKVRANNLEEEDEAVRLVEQLTVGSLIRVRDRRFMPTTEEIYVSLYVQSATYTWQEPSEGSPYLYPDMEVVLSNEVMAVESPIEILSNEISDLRSRFAGSGLSSSVGQYLRVQGNKTYLRKDIDDVAHGNIFFDDKIRSYIFIDGWNGRGWQIRSTGAATLDTIRVRGNEYVGNIIGSPSFTSGFTGWGWQIDTPTATAEMDNLFIRKTFTAYEIVYSQIYGLGGSQIVSDINKIGKVEELSDRYRCYMDDMDGLMLMNLREGDGVRIQARTATVQIKYIFGRCIGVSSNYFDIAIPLLEGDGKPQKGDFAMRWGNDRDKDRQGLIYLTSADSGAPYIDVYDGITDASTEGKLKARLGHLTGIRTRRGDQLYGYGAYLNGIYIENSTYILDNGYSVEQNFYAMNGRFESSINGMRDDLSREQGNVLVNSSFSRNTHYWETNNTVHFIDVQSKYLWMYDSFYVDKESVADIYNDNGQNVLRLRKASITQKNEVMDIPGRGEAAEDGKTYSFTLSYKVLKAGKCEFGIEGTDLYYTAELPVSDEYQRYTKEGKWNEKGDFVLSFTGEILIYKVAMMPDGLADAIIELETRIEQTEEYIKLLATKEYVDNETGEVKQYFESQFKITAEQILALSTHIDNVENYVETAGWITEADGLELFATKDYVDKQTGDVYLQLKSAIDVTAEKLSLYATKDYVDTATGDVYKKFESRIDITAEQMSGITSRVDELNHTIESAGWITRADAVSLFAKKEMENGETIISAINVTVGNILIKADRIDLIGAVTFNMFNETLKQQFNDIQADADAALESANSALSQATTAWNKAVSAATDAGNAKENAADAIQQAASAIQQAADAVKKAGSVQAALDELPEWSREGSILDALTKATIIVNGYINTSRIDTDAIFAKWAVIGGFTIYSDHLENNGLSLRPWSIQFAEKDNISAYIGGSPADITDKYAAYLKNTNGKQYYISPYWDDNKYDYTKDLVGVLRLDVGNAEAAINIGAYNKKDALIPQILPWIDCKHGAGYGNDFMVCTTYVGDENNLNRTVIKAMNLMYKSQAEKYFSVRPDFKGFLHDPNPDPFVTHDWKTLVYDTVTGLICWDF